MEFFLITVLNVISYGLLLFMLSTWLTLVFSMMGVLKFAHASFYMLGAYLGYSLSRWLGFWAALVFAPLLLGLLGALFERTILRLAHRLGHVSEMLLTFGLSYVVLEAIQLVWGRSALAFYPPPLLQGPAFTVVHGATSGLHLVWGQASEAVCAAAVCSPFPATRGFIMLVALVMLGGIALLLRRTHMGLIIQAALTHPQAVEALGHNVPRVFMLVFGVGSALAGLAGVIGGSTFVTEPAMAAAVGSIIFVVIVVGGIGSLAGAFWASLLIGLLQTLAVAYDHSLASLLGPLGLGTDAAWHTSVVGRMTLAQLAPVLPYLLLVVMLVVRPRGLLGQEAR